MIMTMMSM